MSDVFEMDAQRILGPLKQDAAIAERVRQDAAVKAAIAIEQERRAQALVHQEALAREAQARELAEAQAVAQLSSLKPLYEARQEAARAAIESLAALWRIESELRAGLSNADRSLQSVEVHIDDTQRGAWRSALRDRAGLPARHMFNAPKSWVTTEGQRVGASAVCAITASIVGPGFIETPRGDLIRFDFA